MKKSKKIILICTLIMSLFSSPTLAEYDRLAYEFNFNDLDGSPLLLSNYKNKVIVVINVASKCGFTNQYEDMQQTWEKYQNKGLLVLAVPSNSFNQEKKNRTRGKRILWGEF